MLYAIDFGTTNSLLGAADGATLHAPIALDPDAKDPTIMRSVMFFPDKARQFYGMAAIQEFVKHGMEGRLLRSFKKFLPVRSFAGTNINNTHLTLEELIGIFLGELRRRANEHFEQDVTSVILGRPARFAESDADDRFAQDRLEVAARKAGFKHIEFCPEPLAAAYEFRSTLTETKTVLVADFGGGTSDFTVLRIGPQQFKPSDVLSMGGVSIAGDAIDGAMMRRRISRHFGADVQYKVPFGSNVLTMPPSLMAKICSPADISLLTQRDTMEFFRNVRTWALGPEDRRKMDQLFYLIHEQIGFDLFEEIERTKKVLSNSRKERFSFERPELLIEEDVTLEQFDHYAHEAVEKVLATLDQTVKDAQLRFADIDLICSTGGTANIVALRSGLEQRFGREKVQQHSHFHSIVHGLIRKAGETV